MTSSPHSVLGVSRTASPQEIRRAFRALSLRLHPDRNPTPDGASRFADVYDAYTALRRQRVPGRVDSASGATATPAAAGGRARPAAPLRAYGPSDTESGRACNVLVY